jgi:hypothetical protein
MTAAHAEAAPLLVASLPIRTVNEANGSHGHWRVKAKRRKGQRFATSLGLAVLRTRGPARLDTDSGLVITLRRVAPSSGLDDDALPGSLKSVRDGITDWLGLKNDRDARLCWAYDQRRGAKGQYAVEVEIAPMSAVMRASRGVDAPPKPARRRRAKPCCQGECEVCMTEDV